MLVTRKSLAPIGVLLAGGLILSACGGDDDSSGASASPSASASVPQIDAAAFTSDFSLM